MRIDACFDSHVHWAATGEFAQRLRLDDLASADAVATLAPEPHHHRGPWLLGFGWDDARWPSAPHRLVLDRWRPGEPIVFTKRDGHARWLSTEAMRRAGLLDPNLKLPAGARVERDAQGAPTGVISDRANDFVDRALPPPDAFSLRRDLIAAARTFNEAGFTHVRDMTCDEAQWHEALRLDQSGLLTLAVEAFFWARDAGEIERVVAAAARARRESTGNLRVGGVKLFLDGALGSEGALISRCYHGREHNGLALWEDEAFGAAVTKAWEAGLDVAVHAIGDAAVDRAVRAADALSRAGRRGRLHLEHAELVRAETVDAMRGLDVRCHLQPSHYLSDRAWLKEKIGALADRAFPWRAFQEAGVAFDFGSDAPIEAPSVARTFLGLTESAADGIPRLLGRPESYMSHPDPGWAPNSYALFESFRPREVVFRGTHLI